MQLFPEPSGSVYHRKVLSEVVITVTGQFQCKSFGDKCTEALSAGTVAVYSDGVIFKSVFILSGNLCTKDSSECTINVCQIYRKLCFLAFIDGICTFLNQNFFIHGFSSSKLYTAFGSKVTFWSLPANGLFRIALKSTLP